MSGSPGSHGTGDSIQKKRSKELNMEFAWLDGWLEELRFATIRRFERTEPGASSDRLKSMSEVETTEGDGYVWIYLGGRIRFVARLRDGIILDAEGGRVNGRKSYGRIGEWEQWDWSHHYPRRVEIWDYENGTITYV